MAVPGVLLPVGGGRLLGNRTDDPPTYSGNRAESSARRDYAQSEEQSEPRVSRCCAPDGNHWDGQSGGDCRSERESEERESRWRTPVAGKCGGGRIEKMEVRTRLRGKLRGGGV